MNSHYAKSLGAGRKQVGKRMRTKKTEQEPAPVVKGWCKELAQEMARPRRGSSILVRFYYFCSTPQAFRMRV